jgi:CheY-like chemotaxis protein
MPRFLLVDDQSHVRDAIVLALRAKNFEGIAVDNGSAALNAFDASHFDLAIVDIYMPGMDGVTLIKALRERNPKLPIVAISGVHLGTSGRTALSFLQMSPNLAGVTCLQKPFRTGELLQAIETAIGVAA